MIISKWPFLTNSKQNGMDIFAFKPSNQDMQIRTVTCKGRAKEDGNGCFKPPHPDTDLK